MSLLCTVLVLTADNVIAMYCFRLPRISVEPLIMSLLCTVLDCDKSVLTADNLIAKLYCFNLPRISEIM